MCKKKDSLIKHNIPKDTFCPLWQAYVDIDFGRLVPAKGYKGFSTFLVDITGADSVRSTQLGHDLYFHCEKKYTYFLMKWT